MPWILLSHLTERPKRNQARRLNLLPARDVKPRALEPTPEHGVLVAEGDQLKFELSRGARAEAHELELESHQRIHKGEEQRARRVEAMPCSLSKLGEFAKPHSMRRSTDTLAQLHAC